MYFIIRHGIMQTSRTVATLLYSRGGTTVITGEASGNRYTFTWQTREVPIDPRDADQFRAKHLHVSSCGCSGGRDIRDQSIRLFEVVEHPS